MLGATLVTWMVDNRPALDERMKEEGSKALIQEFMAAEGGQGLPTPEERLDRARQAGAHLVVSRGELLGDFAAVLARGLG